MGSPVGINPPLNSISFLCPNILLPIAYYLSIMVLFEVEQKFLWTKETLNMLHKVSSSPSPSLPFKAETFRYSTFRDTYYDSHQKLASNGLWVRKRQLPQGAVTWEAKKSHGPNNTLNNTTFEESEDVNTILQWVRASLPNAPDSSRNFGLKECADFTTFRQTLKVEGTFDVVFDETDFGHRVGEVEVMAKDADKAHAKIDAFMRNHGEIFDTRTKPKGKLTAYFEKFGFPEQEAGFKP